MAGWMPNAKGFIGGDYDIGGKVLGLGAKPNVKPYDVNASAFSNPYLSGQIGQIQGYQSGLGTSAAAGNYASMIKQLQAQANGTGGPSVAELQMQQGLDQSNRAAMGLAASGAPGMNPALAMRNALMAQSQNSSNVNQGAAQVRAQEQLNSQSLLNQAVQGQGQEAQARNDLVAKYQAIGMDATQAQFQANQDLEKLKAQNYNAAKGLGIQSQAGTDQKTAAGIGAIGSGVASLFSSGGGAAVASDRRLKTKIKAGDQEVRNLLTKLKPQSFAYKGEQESRVGIMAQDLEKSALGKQLVRRINGMRVVDVAQATGALLAAGADLHARVKKLETGKAA